MTFRIQSYELEIKSLKQQINELEMVVQEQENKDPEDMETYLARQYSSKPYRPTKNIGVGTNDDNAQDFEQKRFNLLAKILFFSDSTAVFTENSETSMINVNTIKRTVTDLFAYYHFNARKTESVMKSYLLGNSLTSFQAAFLVILSSNK